MSNVYSALAVDTLSYVPHCSLAETIDLLADKGCKVLQLSLHPGFLWPSELDARARSKLRQHIDSRGMKVTCVNLPGVEINIASQAVEVRRYSRDLLKQNIGLSADLGGSFAVMTAGRQHPLVAASRQALLGYFREALDELVPFGKQAGAAICVENAPSAFLSDTPSLIEATGAAGHGDVGFCYDLPNGHFIKEDILAAFRKLGNRLKLVHLADTAQDTPKHAPIGQGTIDFGKIHAALQEIGYRGIPVLEVISMDSVDVIEISLNELHHLDWYFFNKNN